MKKIIPLLLQSLVTLGLLVWIFWKADFRAKTWEELAAANPVWLAAGFGAAGVVNFLGAFRWGIFLWVLGVRLPAWQVLRLSFVGLFFNIFLVGAVGGDAVKVVWLVAKGHPKTPALLSVFMDRMSGFGAMVVCSLLFIFLRLDWLMRSEVVADVIKAVLAYLFCAMALMAFSFIVSAKGFTGRLPRRFPGRQRIIEFTNAYFRFITSWKQTALASAVSVVMLLAHFSTFYLGARSLGLRMPVGEFFALMPAVEIISALPISLSGFGLREQLFVTVAGELWGLSGAQAVSVSLVGATLSLLWGLLGLALLPGYHKVVGKTARG